MVSRPLLSAALSVAISAGALPAFADTAKASDRDRHFFESIEGEWSGPGEIVAGKYEGTKFVCTFTGITPEEKIGMTLDGGCRVGMFTQRMTANIESGRNGKKAVFALTRKALNGAMLAHLSDPNTMNITVSVRVEEELVPVIAVSLKRVDAETVGSVAAR